MTTDTADLTRREPPALRVVLGLIEADLAVLLPALPFLYGGVDPVWYFMASANAALLVLLCAAAVLLGARAPAAAFVVPGILLAAALLQQIPLPHSLLEVVAPGVAEIKAPLHGLLGLSSYQPVALDVSSSGLWAGLMAQMGVMFAAAALLAEDRKRMARLFGVVVAAAVIELLYGTVELRAGGQVLLPLERKVYDGFLTGTFVNRNHFADYLVLGFGAAFGGALHAFGRMRRGRGGAGAFVLFAAAAVALGTGVVFTGSRGALFALMVGAAAGVVAAVFLASRSELALPALGLAALVAAAVLLLGGDAVFERFLHIRREFQGEYSRPMFWEAAVRMGAASPVIGTGWGSFESAWSWFAGAPQVDALKVAHAHNDWAEMLAAFGFAAFAAGGTLMFLVGDSFGRVARAGRQGRAFLLSGALAALVGFGVHMTVDFPLAIPALGGTAAVLAGFFFRREARSTAAVKASACAFCAAALVCLAWSFGWSLDGFDGRADGALYPGKRADLLAREARDRTAERKFDEARALLLEAVRDRPADAYLWAELSATPAGGAEERLDTAEHALALSPHSLFVRREALNTCFSLLGSGVSAELEDRAKEMVRAVMRDAGEKDGRVLARDLIGYAGGLDAAFSLLGEERSLPLLLALPSLGMEDEFLWRLYTAPDETFETWARSARLQAILVRLRRTGAWERCARRVLEAAGAARTCRELRAVWALHLVRTGRGEEARTMLRRGWFADSPLLTFLVRAAVLPEREAAAELERFSGLSALDRRMLDFFLYDCDRLSRKGYRTCVLEALEKVGGMFPRDPGIDLRTAELLADMGEYRKAVALLERHLKLVRRYPRFRKVLVECYRRLGYAQRLQELTTGN